MDPSDSTRVELSAADCLALLRTKTIGRIAYTDRALPAIGLVSYSVLNATVLLRSDRLSVALRDAVVAFQADDLGGASGAGWSVTCVGKVAAVPGLDDVLVLEPTLVSGWRAGPAGAVVSPAEVHAS